MSDDTTARATPLEDLHAYPSEAPVLDIDRAAEHLGLTANTLRAYRFKRYPPGHERAFPEPELYVGGGGRVPLWSRAALDAWQDGRSTPATPARGD